MAAVFEVTLMNSGNFSFDIISNILYQNRFAIDSIETMDDWDYNNYIKLPNGRISEIDRLIEKNKIIFIRGIIKEMYNGGAYISSHDFERHSITFWISTNKIKSLNSDCTTEENVKVYNKITEIITQEIDSNSLLFCGIGTEISIPNSNCIDEAIKKAKNISRWIFPNGKIISLPSKFKKCYIEILLYTPLLKHDVAGRNSAGRDCILLRANGTATKKKRGEVTICKRRRINSHKRRC